MSLNTHPIRKHTIKVTDWELLAIEVTVRAALAAGTLAPLSGKQLLEKLGSSLEASLKEG